MYECKHVYQEIAAVLWYGWEQDEYLSLPEHIVSVGEVENSDCS